MIENSTMTTRLIVSLFLKR